MFLRGGRGGFFKIGHCSTIREKDIVMWQFSVECLIVIQKPGRTFLGAMETGVQSKKIPVSSLDLFPIRCVTEAAERKIK